MVYVHSIIAYTQSPNQGFAKEGYEGLDFVFALVLVSALAFAFALVLALVLALALALGLALVLVLANGLMRRMR